MYNEVQRITANMTALNYKLVTALGEQEYRMEDGWQRMIDGDYVTILQPDAGMSGGFHSFLQIAQWSLEQQDKFKSVVIPHSPGTDDFLAIYTLHFMNLRNGPYPNIGWWQEFGCDKGIPTKDTDFIFTPKLQINKNGTITINNAIGWGYTLKPSNDIQSFYHAQA